eukprot:93712_1
MTRNKLKTCFAINFKLCLMQHYSRHSFSAVQTGRNFAKGIHLIEQQMERNQNPSSPSTLASAPNTSFENHHMRNLIHKCESSNAILSIIEQHKDKLSIVDAATFGKAMQKCNKLGEYSITINLMNILLNQSNITPSIIEFNILFDGLCIAQDTHSVAHYIDIMVNKYKIKPDIFTFCLLLKGCRHRATYDLAQQYWDLMVHKFNIEPNEIAYNELMLVYSQSHKKQKLIDLFNEYLSKLKTNELALNAIIFQSYLNIYCR